MEITFPGLDEDDQFTARTFVENYLQRGNSIDYAFKSLLRLGLPEEKLKRIATYLKEENDRVNNLRRNDPRGLHEKLADNWFFGNGDTWLSYKNFLESKGTFLKTDLEELDRTSSDILNQGLSPAYDQNFRAKRGLVLGYVQSGKTTNFISVIAKAVDAGYKLIVILTGMNENLRLQTQLRIERQLVKLNEKRWILLTDMHSDFRKNSKNVKSTLIGLSDERPVAIAVMKKNQAILGSFYNWLDDLSFEERQVVPMLVIDDEADQASPDAGRGKTQSKINFRIEEFTDPEFMPKNAYLGYTATPFANIFMDASTDRKLYPKDLIYPIKPGNGYFGALELYGRDQFEDETRNIPPEIFVIRDIPQSEGESILDKSWNYSPSKLDSEEKIIESVYWFILAGACRNYRTATINWNTMLIHTAHQVSDHFELAIQIKKLVKDLKSDDFIDSVVMRKLESIWINELNNEMNSWEGPAPAFSEIRNACREIIIDLKVCVDNYKSTDRIYFEDFDEFGSPVAPRPQIVVGGNTLSRGLTLEGLVSTYFMRKSEQYDTVLQMARWFGYRPGYQDLIRVWMPNYEPKMFKDTFKKLALVETEIRDEIEEARRNGLTPLQLPARVRKLPGLQITRKAAMKFAVPQTVSYAGQRQQINAFENNKNILFHNKSLGLSFISDLKREYGISQGRNSNPIFRFVSSAQIIQFLDSFEYFNAISNDNMKLLARYIEKANSEGELTSWNVYLANPENSADDSLKYEIDGHVFKKIRRAKEAKRPYLLIPTITSPLDPICDITIDMLKTDKMRDVYRRSHISKREISELRQEAFSDISQPGLLGLYLIDKDSKYVRKGGKVVTTTKEAPGYADLEAVEDVLALSATVPTPPNTKSSVIYLTLDPEKLPADSYVDEEDSIIEDAEDFYGQR